MEKKEKWWKKFSIFQIVCFACIIALAITIFVQIGIIINLNNKINNLKEKNNEISQEYIQSYSPTQIERLYLNKINNQL